MTSTSLTESINTVTCICTTADIWSVSNQNCADNSHCDVSELLEIVCVKFDQTLIL